MNPQDQDRSSINPQDNSNNQNKNTGLEFQDSTVQALLAKARKEAEERSHMYAKTGGVLQSVPPGVRKEMASGLIAQEIGPNRPETPSPVVPPTIEGTKFEAVPIEETPPQPTHDPLLKNLRTYQGDVAEALKDKDASIVSIALATRKKAKERPEIPQTPQEKSREKKNTWLAIGSAFLLMIGLAILGGLYYVKVQNLPVPVAESPKTIISADRSTEILFQGLTRDKFMSVVYSVKDKVDVPLGEVNHLNIIKRGGATNNTATVKSLTGQEFLSLMKARSPLTIQKSLGDKFMLGVHQGKRMGVFILFSVNSYDIVFDGMLKWEKDLWNDFGALFSQNPVAIPAKAIPVVASVATTSTSTKSTATTSIGQIFTNVSPLPSINIDTNKISSTTSFLPGTVISNTFVDKVISNKDTRILQNDFKETVFVYGFVTKDLLLLASSEETFKAILDRAFAAENR